MAGWAGACVFTVGWIAGGFLQAGSYSWSSQEISDLGSLTARYAWVWNLADIISGALIVVFAISFYSVVKTSWMGRLGAALMVVVGVGGVFDGVLREDCPLSTSEHCQHLQNDPGLSWHHQAHDLESVLVSLAVLTLPFAVARALPHLDAGWGLRVYSVATGVLLVVFTAAYVGLYGSGGGGIAQRFVATAFMIWIGALSFWVLGESRQALARR